MINNDYQKLESNIWINITLWALEYGSSNFRGDSFDTLLSALPAHGRGDYGFKNIYISLFFFLNWNFQYM